MDNKDKDKTPDHTKDVTKDAKDIRDANDIKDRDARDANDIREHAAKEQNPPQTGRTGRTGPQPTDWDPNVTSADGSPVLTAVPQSKRKTGYVPPTVEEHNAKVMEKAKEQNQ